MAKTDNKVSPIRITDPETNDTYVLEFSRESVRFAEQRGFKISELLDFPQSNIPAFFSMRSGCTTKMSQGIKQTKSLTS